MKTGVDKILQQMGGSPEKNKTGVDKILEILENGGGGGGLPEYTSADAGKVLTVNEDGDGVEWESASKTAVVRLSAEGMGSGEIVYGYIAYAIRENNEWVFASDNENETSWRNITGYGNAPDDRAVIVNIPDDDNVRPFFLANASLISVEEAITGNITQEQVHYSFGSLYGSRSYKINGSGSIDFVSNI